MPALLTSSGRPGFYFRILGEGNVAAGDEIVKVGEATERMTVADINALLYSPHHPRNQLERALRLEALSPGWRGSFQALLHDDTTSAGGNAGLVPAIAAHPVAPGFTPLAITAVDRDGEDVLSLVLEEPHRQPLQTPLPGQYVVVRIHPAAGVPPLFRSYSLSGGPSLERYRISVKIEPSGEAGTYLRGLAVGDVLDVSLPRGSFTLSAEERPVVLLSAGIGVTPVLSMLYSLAESKSTRQVFWLYQARDRQHHPFADEVRRLILALSQGRSYVCYSRPGSNDRLREDFDGAGHLSRSLLEQIGVPTDADVYLCGPTSFMADMKAILAALGLPSERVHVELFNGSESMMPGVIDAVTRPPHLPERDASTGQLVSFARSGITAHWDPTAYQSLLELAEACDVPVRWSCRTGVCHNCESGLVSGAVVYGPEPLDRPAEGNLLPCCSQPIQDVVIDL